MEEDSKNPTEYAELINRVHREACEQHKDSYIDPKSGYMVFTSYYHLQRGECCRSGCRHCPYGFKDKS